MTRQKNISPPPAADVLRAAIDDIAGRLAKLPPATAPTSGHGWYARHQARQAAAEELVGYLRREHGARVTLGATPERMRLHGISVSCTSGVANMIHAWLHKARTALSQMGNAP